MKVETKAATRYHSIELELSGNIYSATNRTIWSAPWTYQNIIVKQHEGVGVNTLNRPEVLNAVSINLFQELDEAVQEMEADSQVKAVIFTGGGRGERAFSAGADIKEMARLAENPDFASPDPRESRTHYAWRVAVCTKPTVGAINRLAYGGGAIQDSALDLRVGCERTSFLFLAVSYGRVNSTWVLAMPVGWPMAKELLFTGRVVEAEEACRIGLLNHLVPSDKLMPTAIEIAQDIAANDPRMVQGLKELLIQDVGATWEDMYNSELEAQQSKLKPPPVTDSFKSFLDRKDRR